MPKEIERKFLVTANAGLIVAELEFTDEKQSVALPPWVSKEVTDDARSFNSNLARHPFKRR